MTTLFALAACGGGDGGSSDNPGQNDPTAAFATTTTVVAESFGTVLVRVLLSEVSDESLEVPFTIGGTAIGAVDYTASASPLQIAAGETEGRIFIDLVDDTDADGNNTVVLTLGEFDGGVLGTPDEHTLTIQDDDGPLPEIEDNDNVPQAVANGTFGTLSVDAISRMSGHIYDMSNLLDPDIDRLDAFLMDVPAEINATVTVTPLGNADVTILLGGPGGNALIPGDGIQNDFPAGEAETYSLNLPAGADFFVAVFCIENDADYLIEVEAGEPVPLPAGDGGPGHNPASIESPILRYWLEVNGLLPEQPAVVERRLGWIVDGDQVHGYTEEIVRKR